MSRVIEQRKAARVSSLTVSYIQQFWNALDSQEILQAGTPRGGSDILGALDKSSAQQKWDLLNDWMTTNGTWTGNAGATSFRISQSFRAEWPTPAVWMDLVVLRADDPFKIFLAQLNERRRQYTDKNGVKHRPRIHD
jgi:hypothetical protein